jgi:hypothetical protein
MHTTTVATARDIMAGCSEKTAQDDNTISASAAKYRTFSSQVAAAAWRFGRRRRAQPA